MKRIDLHTHSRRSDGTDCPWDLVMKAKEACIDVLAITDHDTTAGWAEAIAAADEAEIRLVLGLELSTKNAGQSQHLLAYGPDKDDPGLVELLRETISARDGRIPAMVEKIKVTEKRLRPEDVRRITGNATPGRPHIADALVECGAVRDRAEAFATYLNPGCATYVARWAPEIEDAIRVVTAAGGVTVMAHPWGKGAHVTRERFSQLKDCGLRGIEVEHQEHDAVAREELERIARDLELVFTGSSDYHGTGKADHDLGCNLTEPEQFERLNLVPTTKSRS